MQLSIVIVNWNTGALLQDCLASLAAASAALPAGWSLGSVIVVDNASDDGSADHLEFPHLPLQVLRNTANLGFGAACNQGARAGTGDFLLLLNPDTRLFADSLAVPVQWLSDPAHQRTGIVGIPLVNSTGAVERSCARFPRARHFAAQALALDRVWPAQGHLMREWRHDATRSVDQVIGAFFLVRRSLWDALGGFDERFFVYFEEVDFSMRARQQGWGSTFLAEARAFHVGGGSSGRVKGLRLFYSLRSRLQYADKHFGPLERLMLAAVTWGLEPLARGLHLLATRRAAELPALLQGYRMLWYWLRQHQPTRVCH